MYQTVFLRNSIISICTVVLVSCSNGIKESPLPYYNTPDFNPEFIANTKNIDKSIPHTIANFSFTDQHGKAVTQKDIEGKIHVANFMFTSCGSICPEITKNLKLVQKAFKNDSDVVILSYSVTPWIDSVNRLKTYALKNQITSPNWHLLTGDKGDIYKLARKSYYAEEDLGFTKDSTQFLHTEHILLVDKTKRIRGIYNGTLPLEMEQLIKDIRKLQKE